MASFEYIAKKLDELSDRVARIEADVENLRSSIEELKKMGNHVSELKVELATLRTEVHTLKQLFVKRNGYLKWLLATLITVLSFLAALMGIQWVPPG